MKSTFFFVCAALMMGVTVKAQDGASEMNAAVEIAKNDTVQPQFPGGEDALNAHFEKYQRYPKLAQKYGVEGRVIMQFFIEPDGTVSRISARDCKLDNFSDTRLSKEPLERQKQLMAQFALLLAQEGARVLHKMPKWTPGRVGSEYAPIQCSIPMVFTLPKVESEVAETETLVAVHKPAVVANPAPVVEDRPVADEMKPDTEASPAVEAEPVVEPTIETQPVVEVQPVAEAEPVAEAKTVVETEM